MDLTSPVVDKIFKQREAIEKLDRENQAQQEKLNELDGVVYNKAEEFDVFQNIFKKIL